MNIRCLITMLVAGLGLSGCGGDSTSEQNPFAGFTSKQYEDLSHWLCHPDLGDRENICARDLDTTVVFPDGSTEIRRFERPEDPAVDCFYVYPTVSIDEGGNSDLMADEEERFVTYNQAARYSSLCRIFAPVHRQVTLTPLISGGSGEEGDSELAYGDVLEAFKWYIANRNQGRGYVVIGHSQGTGYLRRLVDEVIEEDEYLAQRLIAAHLIGSTVNVPTGSDVGDSTEIPGSLDSTPVCTSDDQAGCIVSFGSYRVREVPVDPAVPQEGDVQRVCVNPAAPGGGSAVLDPYFPKEGNPLLDMFLIQDAPNFPFAEPGMEDAITTPFISMPDFVSAECVHDPDRGHVLEVSVMADPNDPRADDFNGEVIIFDEGDLHIVDMTLTMGNLVDLAASQAAAWMAAR